MSFLSFLFDKDQEFVFWFLTLYKQVRGLSYITRTFKGENVGRFGVQNLLTIGGEGWSTKEKLLTVVDGSRRGRV